MNQVPTVLLVEDSPDDEQLLVEALGRCAVPHRLVVAHDGIEAMEVLLARGRGETPRFVLLDLNLPRLDGIGVLREKARHPHLARIPVVVMTTSSDPADVAACYRLGANSFLTKPMDHAEFRRGASVLLTYWLTMNLVPC